MIPRKTSIFLKSKNSRPRKSVQFESSEIIKSLEPSTDSADQASNAPLSTSSSPNEMKKINK